MISRSVRLDRKGRTVGAMPICSDQIRLESTARFSGTELTSACRSLQRKRTSKAKVHSGHSGAVDSLQS